MSSTLDIREHLLQSNDEFRQLAREHSAYDEKLSFLLKRHFLSEEEKIAGSEFEEVEVAGQGPNGADDSSSPAGAGVKVRGSWPRLASP